MDHLKAKANGHAKSLIRAIKTDPTDKIQDGLDGRLLAKQGDSAPFPTSDNAPYVVLEVRKTLCFGSFRFSDHLFSFLL